MKKNDKNNYIVAYIVLFIILLSGCGINNKKNINISKPNQIIVDNLLISYTDKEYKKLKKHVYELRVDNPLSDIYSKALENKEDICIITNEIGKIREIKIYNSNIKTYTGISVGDNVTDIENNFKYINRNNEGFFMVYFDENGEIDYNNKLLDDDILIIQYKYKNNIITRIDIYDNYFSKYFY